MHSRTKSIVVWYHSFREHIQHPCRQNQDTLNQYYRETCSHCNKCTCSRSLWVSLSWDVWRVSKLCQEEVGISKSQLYFLLRPQVSKEMQWVTLLSRCECWLKSSNKSFVILHIAGVILLIQIFGLQYWFHTVAEWITLSTMLNGIAFIQVINNLVGDSAHKQWK